MFREVGGVVAAGINVEFMRDLARGENFVEGGGAGFETEIVLIATIKIYFQACEISGACHGNGAVLIPENGIGGIAENASQDARAGRVGFRATQKIREPFD